MKKVVYVDMDNVLVDFQSGIDQLNDDILKKYNGRLDEVPGIFGLMKPMQNAIESYIELTKHFDVYILSTSPWENETALIDKLRWVKKYLGEVAYKRLILSHHKNLNKGEYLIDDRTKNGADMFEGEHIHFGTEKFLIWADVIRYLTKELSTTKPKLH
jgi:5'-nucleotidase